MEEALPYLRYSSDSRIRHASSSVIPNDPWPRPPIAILPSLSRCLSSFPLPWACQIFRLGKFCVRSGEFGVWKLIASTYVGRQMCSIRTPNLTPSSPGLPTFLCSPTAREPDRPSYQLSGFSSLPGPRPSADPHQNRSINSRESGSVSVGVGAQKSYQVSTEVATFPTTGIGYKVAWIPPPGSLWPQGAR